MSPARRIILFVASPLSISSFRLIVMVLDKAGGSADAEEFREGLGTVVLEDAVPGAGPSGPSAGGSVGSDGASSEGRLTITVSPASLATPPASAKTSRRVTGRSA